MKNLVGNFLINYKSLIDRDLNGEKDLMVMRRLPNYILRQIFGGVKAYSAKGIDDFIHNKNHVRMGRNGIYVLLNDVGFVLDYTPYAACCLEDCHMISSRASLRHNTRSRLNILLTQRLFEADFIDVFNNRIIIDYPELYMPNFKEAIPELIYFKSE